MSASQASPVAPPPPATASGSSASTAPLPSYYTAYWQKQQQQQQSAPAYPQYPYPYHAYPYTQHPVAPPTATPSAAVPSEAGASAAAPHSAASSAAPAAGGADPAAMAAYHEEYARWYKTHYAPYLAAVAQQQQQYGYAPAAAASPAHSTSLPASGVTAGAGHALSSSPSSAAAAGNVPHAHQQYGYSYSPHPSAPQHPVASPSAATAASSASSHSRPLSPATTLPASSDTAASKRSRWGMAEAPPASASPHAHPASTHPTAVSPSAASQHEAASSPSSAGSAGAVSSVWSPDVVEYVKRSLQWCPPAAKEAVEQWMRARLQQAVDSGEVGRIDWKAEPLAHTRMLAEQLKARDERAAMAQEARRRIEEERRSWELRQQREPEPEQDQLNGRHRHHRKDGAAEERKGGWSDEGEEKDSGASHRPHSLSRAQKRKRDRGLRQSQSASPLPPPSRPPIWQLDSEDQSRNEHRASRFSAYVQEAASRPLKTRIRTELFSSAGGGGEEEESIDWSSLHIVGSSTALEKSYFRLTSAPDPATVRPPAVLRQALERLLSHWAEHREYAYLCDQMKAIRQDLTVQHVHDAFTVRVYEEHARVALDVGDLSEYNQCQTQLATLYGDVQEDGARDNEAEFIMYRIAYCMITNNQSKVISILATLSPEQRQLPPIAHVLELRKAVAVSDFYSFLRGYRQTPYRGVSLLQHLAVSLRYTALTVLVRAYRPTRVELDMFTAALGFDSKHECRLYITSCGAALSDDGEYVLTATSSLHSPSVPDDDDTKQDDKHGITHALFSHT